MPDYTKEHIDFVNFDFLGYIEAISAEYICYEIFENKAIACRKKDSHRIQFVQLDEATRIELTHL